MAAPDSRGSLIPGSGEAWRRWSPDWTVPGSDCQGPAGDDRSCRRRATGDGPFGANHHLEALIPRAALGGGGLSSLGWKLDATSALTLAAHDLIGRTTRPPAVAVSAPLWPTTSAPTTARREDLTSSSTSTYVPLVHGRGKPALPLGPSHSTTKRTLPRSISPRRTSPMDEAHSAHRLRGSHCLRSGVRRGDRDQPIRSRGQGPNLLMVGALDASEAG